MPGFRISRLASGVVALGVALGLFIGSAQAADARQPAAAQPQSAASDSACGALAAPLPEQHDRPISEIRPLPAPKHLPSAPRLLFAPSPRFPQEAAQGKFAGNIVVGITVDAKGAPQQVHIVCSPEPAFNPAALQAVMQYRFRPALLDGKPVPVKVNIALPVGQN